MPPDRRDRHRSPHQGLALRRAAGRDDSGEDLIWFYEDPLPEATRVGGLLCFFNEKVDIELDGELQQRPTSPWSHGVKPDAQNAAPAQTRG